MSDQGENSTQSESDPLLDINVFSEIIDSLKEKKNDMMI